MHERTENLRPREAMTKEERKMGNLFVSLNEPKLQRIDE
jgi:hypothetical protein